MWYWFWWKIQMVDKHSQVMQRYLLYNILHSNFQHYNTKKVELINKIIFLFVSELTEALKLPDGIFSHSPPGDTRKLTWSLKV